MVTDPAIPESLPVNALLLTMAYSSLTPTQVDDEPRHHPLAHSQVDDLPGQPLPCLESTSFLPLFPHIVPKRKFASVSMDPNS